MSSQNHSTGSTVISAEFFHLSDDVWHPPRWSATEHYIACKMIWFTALAQPASMNGT